MNENIDIYTSLEEAKVEIQKRWNDKELRKKVEDYLGEIPEFFQKEPRAVLFRNIMLGDTEYLKFLEHAKNLELKPLGLEYLDDQFCTRNADKLRLGRIDIFQKMNKKNEPIIKSERIIDFIKNDNKKLGEVETFWGEKLVDFFHHFVGLQKQEIETHDMSEWIVDNGKTAEKYYEKFFAFFICHGILIDNFMFEWGEDEFTEQVVYPAFEKVRNIFGIKPLIVELFPQTEIDRCDQWYFPIEIGSYIEEARNNNQS